jgi:phosphate transport system substrate-binding protein
MSSLWGHRRPLAIAGAALAIVLALGLLVAACGSSGDLPSAGGASSTSGAGPLKASLNGAGATFPQPVYVEWIGAFQKIDPGVTINYQGVGSGGGIQQFTQMTVDFGASDAPMTDAEIATAEKASGAQVLHIPTVFGAITLAYNLQGVDGLKLDSDTLAAIFEGAITKWNDPKIAALNQGVTLPSTDIQVVHRSDSSGTTNAFTSYLAAVSPDWKTKIGAGKTVKWPVGVGGQGNDGVAAVVKQQAGSIGYVELAYALTNQMTVAQMKNKSGQFIVPSLDSTTAAAEGAQFPADLRFSVSNSDNPKAYPIVTATWILAYDKMKDPAKAAALKAFLTWALNDGASIATDLGYAPLPSALKDAALVKVNAIGS